MTSTRETEGEGVWPDGTSRVKELRVSVECEPDHPQAKGSVLNIGGPREHTVWLRPERVPVLPASVAEELALMLGWALDWIADVHEVPLADEEPESREKFDRATAALIRYQDTKEAEDG